MSSKSISASREPRFDFFTPPGYRWLLEHRLVGFYDSSVLEPWYYLERDEVFNVTDEWPQGPSKDRLVAFAKRQDCDDIACFEIGPRGASSVIVIHGWTDTGYDIVARYENFWEWLKSVIDDIAEWVEAVEND
jgi:hypothetical protein